MRDITERKVIEDQLRQAQKMAVVGQLTGGVAHDFNNLLAVISGNLEFLEDRLASDDIGKEFLGEAIGAVDNAAGLTRQLLAFSRQQLLRPEIVDVNDRIRRMLEMLRRTLAEMDEIRAELETDIWMTNVDPTQLEAATLNLALNARDAMPEGGRLTIETTNTCLDPEFCEQHEDLTPGDYVAIAIRDTGRGMTPEEAKHAFEPFYTTKEVGEGSGLGLGMVYGFAKQSGGHAMIESEPDGGTVVWLFLPRSDAVIERNDDAVARRTAPPGGNETILVVEDDAGVRNLTCRLLQGLGYAVLEAEDGRTAIAVARSNDGIDLLLTDVMLPGGMNGLDIAREITGLKPDVKVLYTSGHAAHALVSAGDNDPEKNIPMLPKPYKRHTLATRVRDILDGAAN